jgi:hypothetical protein
VLESGGKLGGAVGSEGRGAGGVAALGVFKCAFDDVVNPLTRLLTRPVTESGKAEVSELEELKAPADGGRRGDDGFVTLGSFPNSKRDLRFDGCSIHFPTHSWPHIASPSS